MASVGRIISTLSKIPAAKCELNLSKVAKRNFTHLVQRQAPTVAVTAKKLASVSSVCSCGCGRFQGLHTRGKLK